MCFYYPENKYYQNFVKTLQDEYTEYRDVAQKMAAFSKNSKKELKEERAKVKHSINRASTPTRVKTSMTTLRSQKKDFVKRNKTSLGIPSIRSDSMIKTEHMPMLSIGMYNAMPARKNGAKRIYEPEKLSKIKSSRSDQTLLVGKRIRLVKRSTIQCNAPAKAQSPV